MKFGHLFIFIRFTYAINQYFIPLTKLKNANFIII